MLLWVWALGLFGIELFRLAPIVNFVCVFSVFLSSLRPRVTLVLCRMHLGVPPNLNCV